MTKKRAVKALPKSIATKDATVRITIEYVVSVDEWGYVAEDIDTACNTCTGTARIVKQEIIPVKESVVVADLYRRAN